MFLALHPNRGIKAEEWSCKIPERKGRVMSGSKEDYIRGF